jgi:hypothetical protein
VILRPGHGPELRERPRRGGLPGFNVYKKPAGFYILTAVSHAKPSGYQGGHDEKDPK